MATSLRSRPGRGRSLIAASNPASTNRLRTLATVAALSETAAATSRSARPASAFNSARARFTVRANGLPRPDVSISAERSDWVSSTLYLETGMSGTASLKDFTQAYLISLMIVRLSGNGTRTDFQNWMGPCPYCPLMGANRSISRCSGAGITKEVCAPDMFALNSHICPVVYPRSL